MLPANRSPARVVDAQDRSGPRGAAIAAALLGGALGGGLGLVPRADGPMSIGTTSSGVLRDGRALAESGVGYVRARRGEDTRYGTPRLLGAIERATASVAAAHPGTRPARVGDIGAPLGGRHPRHHSHRSGRDVDVLFYLSDGAGRPVDARGWLAFSRFGHAEDRGALYTFDDARNWHFVRTLLLDPEADVQWIFVSRGVESRLLRYAMAHEPERELLVRAAYVLLQPERAAPHDDHFHVRIYCTADERAGGCVDRGPRWPWLRPDVEEIAGLAGPGLDDASLVAFLLEGGDPAAEP